MAKTTVIPLDLNFQGNPKAIACYLIKHKSGAVLIESGPGSTLKALEKGLEDNGLTFRDVTHVLLTHIHLDHAGAAGRLAHLGATIYVHPAGAPHLVDPERLLASATRIYGEKMESLWGEFLPVPEEKIKILRHEEEFEIDDLQFVALHTPGHAEHHISYLFEDIWFSGDVGGVRIPGYPYLRVPMPPPELNFEKWHASISLLRNYKLKKIAPTHFGIFDDVDWHLTQVEAALRKSERWIESVMPGEPSIEVLRDRFATFMEAEASALHMDAQAIKVYALANPLGMSADGLQRYWRKYRAST